MSASLIDTSLLAADVGGLFGTMSLMAGLGMSTVYTVFNRLPIQYFSGHLGLANGLAKLDGGACVLAAALETMHRRVGIVWTFRIQGLLNFVTGLPAAWMQTGRVPLPKLPLLDISLFHSIPFVAVFLAGAIELPAALLPVAVCLAYRIKLEHGCSLVAAFNACNAVGRFVAGPLCDKLGPVNMFLITMTHNAVSMLAIWPVSSSTSPLAVFASLNGAVNGSLFTSLPAVVAGMFGSGRAAMAMSMAVAGWSGGYRMGSPIADYLL